MHQRKLSNQLEILGLIQLPRNQIWYTRERKEETREKRTKAKNKGQNKNKTGREEQKKERERRTRERKQGREKVKNQDNGFVSRENRKR